MTWYSIKEMALVVLFGSFCGFLQGYFIVIIWLLSESGGDALLIDFNDGSRISENLDSNYILIYICGETVGSCLGYLFSDSLGRNLTIRYFLAILSALLAWTALSLHQIPSALIILLGICMGIILSTSPIYISECSPTFSRGQCIAAFSLAIVFGNKIAGFIFWLTSTMEQKFLILFLFPCCIALMACYGLSSLPESPRWLLSRKTPTG